MWFFLLFIIILFLSIFHSKREGVDVVIVYMHWGREYKLHPNRRQMSIAKYLHSLGVLAVIGAHPHVLQPHSRTTDHLTAYSVGNFLFPQIKECLTVGFLFQSCRVHWLSEMKPQARKLTTNFPYSWKPQRTLTIVIQEGIALKVFKYGVQRYHGETLCFWRYFNGISAKNYTFIYAIPNEPIEWLDTIGCEIFCLSSWHRICLAYFLSGR